MAVSRKRIKELFTDKILIMAAITVGFCIGFFVSIYVPYAQDAKDSHMLAITDDYWKGSIDTQLGNLTKQVEIMNKKIDMVCEDVVKVRIRAAETGGIYGGGSALVIYALGTFGKIILEKRKGR